MEHAGKKRPMIFSQCTRDGYCYRRTGGGGGGGRYVSRMRYITFTSLSMCWPARMPGWAGSDVRALVYIYRYVCTERCEHCIQQTKKNYTNQKNNVAYGTHYSAQLFLVKKLFTYIYFFIPYLYVFPKFQKLLMNAKKNQIAKLCI